MSPSSFHSRINKLNGVNRKWKQLLGECSRTYRTPPFGSKPFDCSSSPNPAPLTSLLSEIILGYHFNKTKDNSKDTLTIEELLRKDFFWISINHVKQCDFLTHAHLHVHCDIIWDVNAHLNKTIGNAEQHEWAEGQKGYNFKIYGVKQILRSCHPPICVQDNGGVHKWTTGENIYEMEWSSADRICKDEIKLTDGNEFFGKT